MGEKSFFKSILSFLPLLVLYIAIVTIVSSNTLIGDETRHMTYANNLSHGFYTNSENPELGNGPGYPLVLTAFVLIKAPYLVMKLANAIFLFMAVVLFSKSLLFFLGPKQSIILSYIFGIYPPFLKWSVYLYSESLAIFLACGFLYFFLKLHFKNPKSKLNIIITGLFLGLLTLTKVIFGYVILSTIVFYLIVFFFKKLPKIRASLFVLVTAFIVSMPYLFYTYSITGKMFYWGTGGGEILYWRSSPFPNEYGDWISADVVLGKENGDFYDTTPLFNNHGAFIQSLESHSIIQRDSLYKKRAIENIKGYPRKYIQNTLASGLRLFFNYPYSYTPQKISTYFYIIPNIFVVVFLLFAFFIALRKPFLMPFEIRVIGLMMLLFIGGLTVLDGRVRHLLPILPLLFIFVVFVCRKFVEMKPKTEVLR